MTGPTPEALADAALDGRDSYTPESVRYLIQRAVVEARTIPESPIREARRIEARRIEAEIARAVMASARLEPGRWAVRVEVGDIPELGEVAVRAVASVRVHATIGAGERDADQTSGVQAIAHKLGRELRAVIDAHDADAETMRRLHEEATKRNAALSTALEALLTAYETVGAGGGFDVRQRARNAAREVLAAPTLTGNERPHPDTRDLVTDRGRLRTALEALVATSAFVHDNVWLGEPNDSALAAALDTAREVLAS